MSHPSSTRPYKAATTVKFKAYCVSADFGYIPASGTSIIEHLIQFRFENPNPFIARANAISKIQKIKLALDQPDEKYQYEGISMWLEYSVSPKYRNSKPETKKLYLLNGEIGTREDLLQRQSSEEFLLDIMGYSFICVDVTECKEVEYAELVDSLFDGLKVLDTTIN